MDKREFFLKKLEEIEPKAEKYLQPSKNKFLKILNKLTVVRSKILLLPYLIFLKKFLHKDLKKKIKIGKDYLLKHRDVIELISAAK